MLTENQKTSRYVNCEQNYMKVNDIQKFQSEEKHSVSYFCLRLNVLCPTEVLCSKWLPYGIVYSEPDNLLPSLLYSTPYVSQLKTKISIGEKSHICNPVSDWFFCLQFNNWSSIEFHTKVPTVNQNISSLIILRDYHNGVNAIQNIQ